MRRQMVLLAGVIVFSLSFLPGVLIAQTGPMPQAGARVRIQTTSSPNDWRTGYLSSMDSVQVAIAQVPGGLSQGRYFDRVRPATTPLSTVRSLEVSKGRHARFQRGVIGGVAGTVIGTIAVGVPGYLLTRCDACMFSGLGVILGPIVGAPVGGTVGAIVGVSHAPERWEPVALPAR